MELQKKIFCTFGDVRLKKSLQRIGKQAKLMGIYDHIYINNENDLSVDFQSKFEDKLNIKTRGFGYWCWKPQIILQMLEQMNEGDILQYCDTGCHLNVKGRKRLLEYFDIAKNSQSGVVLFKAKEKEECLPGEYFHLNQEYKFTKGDVFKYFGVTDNNDVIYTNQFAGTICFIKKTNANVDFIKSWLHVFEQDFSLIDDSESNYPNFEGFVEHRHDQSIISVMAKLRGVEKISLSEIYTENDWSELDYFPIWALRDKNYGIKNRLKKAIYPIYKFVFKS